MVANGGKGGTAGAGGAGNMGGTAGAGGGASLSKPSAGCAKAEARPAGGQVIVAGQYYFTFPASYDGKKPLPVFVGFHGCSAGNRGTSKDNTEWISLSKGTAFETEYVRAVPISSDAGGCWNYTNDIPAILKMYDDLVANHCVDTAAVFATGHSSGAQLLVQILSDKHPADAKHLNIKAVAPVAASDYGALSGPTPIMYIQGKMDAERGNGDGHETVERFKTANKCMNTSMAYTPVMSCNSLSGGVAVAPGCVSYAGCTVPTIWCSHNDPFYSGTMHGVPCFAMKAMSDFFQTFR
jgi:polyhydroxybutyrate depolymerase